MDLELQSNIDLERVDGVLNSHYWLWRFEAGSNPPPSLLELLHSELSHLPPESWETRFRWGGVYLNGIAVLENSKLTAPCKIEYYEPKPALLAQLFDPPRFCESQIVYEDDDLLIVFKPAGIPCMPAKEQSIFSLYSQIVTYLGHSVHMPSRLDLSTSGVVIISKSMPMHSLLQQCFEQRSIKKEYLLQSTGSCGWTERIVDLPIGKHPLHPVLRQVGGEAAKQAKTLFRLLTFQERDLQEEKYVTLLATPLTGRTHQIRVHSAALGLPIVGDSFYGGSIAPGLRLLSYQLTLRHPFSGSDLVAKVPDRYLPKWLSACALPSS